MEFERFDMTIPPVRTRWYLRPLTIIVSLPDVLKHRVKLTHTFLDINDYHRYHIPLSDTIVPGAKVEKGDPLGYFLFGGSDIVMLFIKDLDFEFTAEKDEHLLMGQEYGRLGTK